MADPRMHIYFASQSGTAQYFAEELQDEASEHSIAAEVIDLAAFSDVEFAAHKVVVLVVSTYGDGDPPDNAISFHRWACDAQNDGLLKGQRFCVMALGDMNYINFCGMGVITDANLERMGSKRIYQRGMGDDGSDLIGDFKKWRSGGLWDSIKNAIAEVEVEEAQSLGGAPKPALAAGFAYKDVYLYFGHEEEGGAARDVCEELVACLTKQGLRMPKPPQSLQDRKAVDGMRKLPKGVIVVIMVDCTPDGFCAAGRKMCRNMKLEMEVNSLVPKSSQYAFLAVATSKCSASAAEARPKIEEKAADIVAACDRVGLRQIAEGVPGCVDTGEGAFAPRVAELGAALTAAALTARSSAPSGTPVLKMATDPSELPAEVPCEPADVLARFYFEANHATVLKVNELRQEPNAAEGSSTAEIEIAAAGDLGGYALGGTLSVLPENDPADVAAMLPLLGLQESDLKRSITFAAAGDSNAKVKQPFPTPCTLGEALTRYCDLNRPPTKKTLMALQAKLKDDASRDYIAKLLKNDDALRALHAEPFYCKMHQFWSLLGVKDLDLNEFLIHCPRQKAREFTIASSPKAAPERITICVSLTSKEVPSTDDVVQQLRSSGCLPDGQKAPLATGGRFYGACSRWITTRLKAGDKVLAKQRPSNFRLPESDVPIIMVGSGAGVAPFRGFWEELRRGPQAAPAALFFGCRHPDKDWLFKEDMSRAVKNAGCAALARVQAGPKRPLACLFPAFSRPGDGKESKYVQDQVRAQGVSVKHWMEKMDGVFYICGSTAMGKGVLDALAQVLEGGHETVEALRKKGRVVAELWG